MHFTPKDMEKLMLHYAGEVAEKRKRRGLKLNYVESVAYICYQVMEMAREGKTLAETVEQGAKLLTVKDVMEGVAGMVTNVQVEATFTDGTKLISIHNPIGGKL